MSDTPRVGIEVAVDGSSAEAGLARVEAAVTRTGRTLDTLGERGSSALDAVGTQGGSAAGRLDASTRNMINAIQRTTAALDAGSRSSREYYESLASQRGLNVDALRPYLEQLEQVSARQAAAREGLDATAGSLGNLGQSAAQTDAAMQNLPAQFTDIVTSLQAGQEPLTVLLQQGGQLRDMFGSAGGAARAMGTYLRGLVNPYTIAAAAALALVAAYHQGSAEADAYNRALIMTGNAAATTAGELADMARGISDTIGTQGEAAAALAALAGTGDVSSSNLQRFGEVAVRAQKAIGTSVDETVQAFSDLAKSPLAASEKLNEQYRYLTVAVYEQIKALEQQGQVEEAAEVAQNAYADAMDERSKALKASLGTIESAWASVTGVAKKAWDSMLNIGREDTLADKLANIETRIAAARGRLYSFIDGPEAKKEIERLQVEQGLLQSQQREQARANEAKDAANKLAAAGIEWSKLHTQYLDKEAQKQNELAAATNKAKAANVDLNSAAFKAVVAGINEKYADKSKENASAIKAEAIAYANLSTAIGERIAQTAREAAGLKPMTESQRLQVDLDQSLASGKLKLTAAHKATYEAQIKSLSVNERVIESQKRAAQGQAEVEKLYKAMADAQARTLQQAIEEADRNEELVHTYGLTKAQIEAVTLARLEDQLAQRSSLGLTLDEIEHLETLIEVKRRSATALSDLEGLQKQKDLWTDIEKTAHDTFVSIADGGKDAATRLKDTFKNVFFDWLYQQTLKKWIINLSGTASLSATGGAAASGAGGSSGGGIGSSLGSVVTSSLGSYFGAGGLSGALTAGAGWMTGATTFGGALSAGASLVGTGTLGGIASGMGVIAGALGPIALGVAAVMAIVKGMDDSGTYHTGGASSASAAGTTTIRAESLNFQATKVAQGTNDMTAQLASSVVKILDSTATTFGKAAGYTAATAFADDTSKDGAWGALLIKNIEGTLVNWQDTRTSRWAPKEFADGEAGQAQYLAAIASSTRDALNSIGLPEWAKNMVASLGNAPTLEQLATVVDQVNATQSALVTMGQHIAGFANMTSNATSALLAASGGIAALSTNASTYYDAFYTEAEKNKVIGKQIAASLQLVNLAMPATREEFRAMVDQQLALGAAGAPAVAALLGVSGAFAQIVPAADAAAEAAKAAAEAQEAAAQAAKEAQDAARSSLNGFISQMKDFATTAAGLNNSLVLGSMSTLTPEQQYAEARRQFEQTRQLAYTGDANAQGNLDAIEQAFLQISQTINGGDSQYSSDLATVMRTNEDLAQWATGSVDVAQASLDQLTGQSASLANIQDILAAIAQGNSIAPVASASPVATQAYATVDYTSYGSAQSAALVAEIKALREEVKGLRADAARQTGDQITAITGAADDAADKIVDGTAALVNGTRESEKRVPV